MADWTPERVLDAAEARALLNQAFPDLSVAQVDPLDEGFDNTAFLVNGALVFRFPRREMALPGFAREAAVMPRLAPRLPVAAVHPTHIAGPTGGFPWPFVGYPLVRGRECAGLDDGARARLAGPLGRLLAALHAPALAAELGPELPGDLFRRADMAVRVPRAEAWLAEAEADGPLPGSAALWGALDEARGLPAIPGRAVVHGDLHFRHLLVDDDDALCGVIDWGDLHLGDPALDLEVVWAVLPPAARPAFFAAYGDVDDATLRRARVVAIYVGLALVAYGAATGRPAVEAEARASLARDAQG